MESATPKSRPSRGGASRNGKAEGRIHIDLVAPPVGARVEISLFSGIFMDIWRRPSRGGASRNICSMLLRPLSAGRPSRGGASRNMYTLLPAVAVNSRPSRGGASRNEVTDFDFHPISQSPLPWGRE